MFRKVFAVMALVFCSATFAASANFDVSGLSDAQVAELKANAAKAVADAAKKADGTDIVSSASNPGAVVTLAATWGQQAAAAAEGFAKAITIAAKELGVTVNDFLHTDAGKLTAILIIWKVAGVGIMKILYGIAFVTIGLVFTRVLYTRLFTKEFIKVPYSRFFGAFTGEKLVRVPKNIAGLNEDGEWLVFWVMIIVCTLTLIVGGAIIT